ncbi:MAG: hypothetical protein IVW55_11945 [Chloroflexi bacterium]|nr:hypothetical protein [Chloroflexota bacterium]
MLLQQKKARGPVRGCLVPLATVVGVLLLCFVMCFVIFQLDQATLASSNSGSSFLFFGG